MKTLLLSLLAVVSVGCCPCMAQSVHFSRGSLVISDVYRKLVVKDTFSPHSWGEVVHAIQKRGQDYFIVVGVSELSKGYPPKGGNCGSGIESHIDWLHIRNGKLLDRQSGLYASCIHNRDGWAIKWESGLLHWTTQGRAPEGDPATGEFIDVTYTWAFDPAHPEAGIKERVGQ